MNDTSNERAVAIETRATAARVIAQVVSGGRFLDGALDEQRRAKNVSSPLLQEICYGTLRWHHRLTGIASLLLERPLKSKDVDIQALLLIGLYQLHHMRVAPHAAVDTTVAATTSLEKSWAKNLVNACLRRALRETAFIDNRIAEKEEWRFSHPQWMIDDIRRSYPQKWQEILAANNERPPMTVRVNHARTSRDRYLRELEEGGLAARIHPSIASALILETPISVDQLPGFSDGLVSVQDAAAQLAAEWLDAQPGNRVLDACAAPGGKAAHILERTPNAELVAVDIEPARISRMRTGFSRLGVNPMVVAGDASNLDWWDGRAFDRVLVDAPCSATGVIRRHPDIKVRRQSDELSKLCQTQAQILDSVWSCLRPGGKLLYVTCSLLTVENTQQVQGFMERHSDAALATSPAPQQIFPGEQDMDGFYYACLLKT